MMGCRRQRVPQGFAIGSGLSSSSTRCHANLMGRSHSMQTCTRVSVEERGETDETNRRRVE